MAEIKEMSTFRAAHGRIGNGVPLVREGSFRQKTKGKGPDDTPIVVRLQKTRYSNCGLRDTMAKTGSSKNRMQLTQQNARLDGSIDHPTEAFVPARQGRTRGRGGKSGGYLRRFVNA